MTSTKTIAVILSLVLLGYLSTLGQTMASPSSVATIINEVTEVSTKTGIWQFLSDWFFFFFCVCIIRLLTLALKLSLDPTATETKTIVVNPTASGSAQ